VALAAGVAACGSDNGDSSSSASSGSSGCKPKHADVKTITKGTLTVASIAYMPSADVVGGKPTGIDGDTITQIAKNECLKLKVNKVAASGAIPLVQTGRADMVIGDWYRSKEREKVVDITVPIYLDSLGVLSKSGASSLKELEGKKLGDLQGNVWNADFKKIIGGGYKLYQTIDQAMSDLQNGRLDASIVTAAQVAYQQKQGQLKGLKLQLLKPDDRVPLTAQQPQSTFPHKKGNTSLTKMLDDNITEMKDSGQLGEIVKKYGVDPGILDTGPPRLV
jgi:polar amino acid transport system substrate-binding protein